MTLRKRSCSLSAQNSGNLKMAVSVLLALAGLSLCSRGSTEEGIDFAADGKEVKYGEASQLLEMWGTQMRSQYERLRTWEGIFEVSDVKTFAPSLANAQAFSEQDLVERHAGKGSFSIDVSSDSLFSAVETRPPVRSFELSPQEQEHMVQGYQLRAVLTPEHYLRFSPNLKYRENYPDEVLSTDQKGGRMAFREGADAASPGLWGPLIDPRYAFRVVQSEELLNNAHSFRILAEDPAKGVHEGHRYRLSSLGEKDGVERFALCIPNRYREGILVRETIIEVGDTIHVSTTTLKDGAGNVKMEMQVTYGKVDGIEVPVQASYKSYREDGKLQFSRDISFETTAVNQPIDEGQFAIGALGLQEGDRYLDKIEGIEYTFRNGELVKATNEPLLKELVKDLDVPESTDAGIPSPAAGSAVPSENGRAAEKDAPAVRSGVSIEKVLIVAALLGLASVIAAMHLKHRRLKHD